MGEPFVEAQLEMKLKSNPKLVKPEFILSRLSLIQNFIPLKFFLNSGLIRPVAFTTFPLCQD